jgi:membrane protein implicated in regulation of membrane protease activity
VFFVLALFFAVFVLPDPWRLPVVAFGAALEITETAISFWLASRAKVKVGPEALIGAVGRVVEQCQPEGQVRVNGEVWRARCEGHARVDDPIRVIDRIGLTLLVERLPPPEERR